MSLTISERLRPFSHTPGTLCPLPGSFFVVQVFPALLRVLDASTAQLRLIEEHPLPVQGPLSEFTVSLDLEYGCVHFWGKAANGFFRAVVAAEEGQVKLHWNTKPKRYLPEVLERLSLGCHKQQDWDLVRRRSDPAEFLPFWLRLSALLPAVPPVMQGTGALLQEGRLGDFFQAGFEGVLTPRWVDTQHHGFTLSAKLSDLSPFALIHAGAAAIRALFVDLQAESLSILPHLPAALHCGRYLNISCGKWGTMDLEWSKKTLRQVILRAEQSGTLKLHFPPSMQQFRLRCSKNDHGVVCSTSQTLCLEAGKWYGLDRFKD